MKHKLLLIITTVILMAFPKQSFAQAPNLGTAANFVLFTTVGAVGNSGISQLTGNVGTNSGSSTGFGNVNGTMNDGDGVSAQCATDLLFAYNQLNATVPTFFPAPLLGNGQILVPGVYAISGAATMNLDLILDGQGNASSVFIIQISGPLSTNANSKVRLINGALACNVFWKVEGLVSMAAGTSMKGTVIANNAAINMNAGDTLEGRALSTSGAVTVDGVMAYTPVGCGSPFLTGPMVPAMPATECYTIFSSDGPVTNTGATYITGDVGTNVGLTTGFNPLFVTGMIHPIPDGSTAAAAADLINVNNYLMALPYDIELLYPAQFGNNLVLTPHIYVMNGAVTFTDSLYLNGMGNPNAVFVIQIYGAMSTSTYSKVILTNGTQSKNVFWNIQGAVDINDYSDFKGTIICNNGAMDINTGVTIDGRALTTTGALNTASIVDNMPPGCPGFTSPVTTTQPANQTACVGSSISFSVVATGSGLTYQWRKGNVNLVNGGNISGATNDTLTINPVSMSDTASNYNVIICGTYSPCDTSNFATLTVGPATSIVITTPPTNQAVCSGSSASFSVIASGTGLTYQWKKGTTSLVNGGNISGATSATLIINPATILDVAATYHVVISSPCAASDSSGNVSLTISPGTVTTITTQPTNHIACAGSPVSFTVVAAGVGLTYQWKKGAINLVNGGSISGATSATLTINPVAGGDAAVNYHVIVSGSCAVAVNSTNASLIVNTAPAIVSAPTTQIACSGNPVSFSVIATGTSITYQWKKGLVNLVNGGNISGATSSTLTFSPATITDTASNYHVVISGTCAPVSNSANVALIITTAPTITTSPTNQTGCVGGSVSFSVTAAGAGLSYQWRKGIVNLVNGGNISGATSSTLTINPVNASDTAFNYNVVVTGACVPVATSANASLTLTTGTSITTMPTNQVACEGTSVSFTVTAGGLGLTYQWMIGAINLINGGNISGATNSTLTINPVTMADAANNYHVMVNGACGTTSSANVSLTVNPLPIVSLGPDNIIQPAPTATLNAGGGFSSYLWNTSDTTQTIVVNTNGIFIVTVTNEFGCANSDTIQVNFTNGIINNDGTMAILALYPNPSNGPVNLSIENLQTNDLVIEIFNMSGTVVTNKYVGSVSGNYIQAFDFSELRTGTYIIRLTANGKSTQMRFMISK